MNHAIQGTKNKQTKTLFGLSSKIKQISKSFKFIRNLAVWQYRTESSDEYNFTVKEFLKLSERHRTCRNNFSLLNLVFTTLPNGHCTTLSPLKYSVLPNEWCDKLRRLQSDIISQSCHVFMSQAKARSMPQTMWGRHMFPHIGTQKPLVGSSGHCYVLISTEPHLGWLNG